MSPSKPAVLVTPGAGQSTDCFFPFADLLKDKVFDAQVVDVPSVGRTQLPLTCHCLYMSTRVCRRNCWPLSRRSWLLEVELMLKW
jgi:hypothetical protein